MIEFIFTSVFFSATRLPKKERQGDSGTVAGVRAVQRGVVKKYWKIGYICILFSPVSSFCWFLVNWLPVSCGRRFRLYNIDMWWQRLNFMERAHTNRDRGSLDGSSDDVGCRGAGCVPGGRGRVGYGDNCFDCSQ